MSLKLHQKFFENSDPGPFTYSLTSTTYARDKDNYFWKIYPWDNSTPVFVGGTIYQNLQWLPSDLTSASWGDHGADATGETKRSSGVPDQLFEVADDTSTGMHYTSFINTISAGNGDPYHYLFPRKIVSCYVQRGTARYITLGDKYITEANMNIWDFETESWTYLFAGNTGGYQVVDKAAGIYRLWFWDSTPGGGENEVTLGISSGPDNGDQTYTGDGTLTCWFAAPVWEVDPTDKRTSPMPPSAYRGGKTNARRNSFGGACDGIWHEEQRTNALTYSQDFSQWSTAGTTPVVTGQNAMGPRGATDAFTLEDDNGAGYEYLTSNTGTKTANATMTASIWILKDAVAPATRFPMFRISFSGVATQRFDMVIDTSTGTIDTGVSAGTGTIADEGVNEFVMENGDTYYQCWFELTDPVANTSCSAQIYPAVGSGTLLYSNISTAATGEISVFHAQLEEGVGPTSMIETTTTATTRSQPIINLQSPTLFGGQQEGAFLARATTLDGHEGGLNAIVTIGRNGVASDSAYISNNGNAARVDHNTGTGNDGLVLQNGVFGDWAEHSVAASFREGLMIASVDGSPMTGTHPDTSVTCPASNLYNEVSIGDHPDVASWEFNGYIAEVAIWDSFVEADDLDIATATPGGAGSSIEDVLNRKKQRDRFRRRYRRT